MTRLMAESSLKWKLMHGLTSFLGSCCFLAGSAVLFPFVQTYMDTRTVSAWFFIIGSLSYLLADITVVMHSSRACCKQLQTCLNSYLSLLSTFFFLIGSIYFLPGLDLAWIGALVYVAAFGTAVFSQIWKLCHLFWSDERSIRRIVEQEETELCVEGFSLLAAVVYFIGTFVLYYSAINPTLLVTAVTTYSCAGNLYLASAIFLLKKYFFEVSPQKEYSRAESIPLSSDL